MYDALYTRRKSKGIATRVWARLHRNPLSVIGMIGFLVVSLLALFPSFFAPYAPTLQFEASNLAPAWNESGDPHFMLGTDDLGRDILSRVVHGARLTLGTAFWVTIVATLSGVVLGGISSLVRSWLDTLIVALLEFIISLPSLLLAIVVVAVIGVGLNNVLLAVTLVAIPQIALATRQAIKEELTLPYVRFAKLDGVNNTRLLIFEIFPNVWPKILFQASNTFSTAILEISALGFLGLGAQLPQPEWGALLSEAHLDVFSNPWSIAIPGFAILISVMSINLVADGIRDALSELKK